MARFIWNKQFLAILWTVDPGNLYTRGNNLKSTLFGIGSQWRYFRWWVMWSWVPYNHQSLSERWTAWKQVLLRKGFCGVCCISLDWIYSFHRIVLAHFIELYLCISLACTYFAIACVTSRCCFSHVNILFIMNIVSVLLLECCSITYTGIVTMVSCT